MDDLAQATQRGLPPIRTPLPHSPTPAHPTDLMLCLTVPSVYILHFYMLFSLLLFFNYHYYSYTSLLLPSSLLPSSIIIPQKHAQACRGVQWRWAPGDPRSAFQFTWYQVKKQNRHKLKFSASQFHHPVLLSFCSHSLFHSFFLTFSVLCSVLHISFYVLLKAVLLLLLFNCLWFLQSSFFIIVSLAVETPHPNSAPLTSHSFEAPRSEANGWK